jgi:hypothetical protein
MKFKKLVAPLKIRTNSEILLGRALVRRLTHVESEEIRETGTVQMKPLKSLCKIYHATQTVLIGLDFGGT